MAGKIFALGAIIAVMSLAGCATSSAVVDGVGGLFVGVGEDIRSIAQ